MRLTLNEDFLDNVQDSDIIFSEDERDDMRYRIVIGDFPLLGKDMRTGVSQIENLYSIVKKYVDNMFEFSSKHETRVVFEWGEPDNNDFTQLKAQHDCSVKELREFMKKVPDEPSFDRREIVFCDVVVDFNVTKVVTFRKFARIFGHFVDTTLYGLPCSINIYLIEPNKTPYKLYKKDLRGQWVVGFDIMRNLYETLFEQFNSFEKPSYEYEPWYNGHSWNYSRLRAGAPFFYLREHPDMFKGFYVYMKCLKTGDISFKTYDDKFVSYVCILEISPKLKGLDNTDSILNLVEDKIIKFFDKKSIETILKGKMIYPVRFVFACIVDRKTVNAKDSNVFYRQIQINEKFEVDIELWIEMPDAYLRVTEDGEFGVGTKVLSIRTVDMWEENYNSELVKHIPDAHLNEDFLDDIKRDDFDADAEENRKCLARIEVFNGQQISGLGDCLGLGSNDENARQSCYEKIVRKWMMIYRLFCATLDKMMFVEEPDVVSFRVYRDEDDEHPKIYTPEEWFRKMCYKEYSECDWLYALCVSICANFYAVPVSIEQFTKDMYLLWNRFCNQNAVNFRVEFVRMYVEDNEREYRVFNDYKRKKFWQENILGAYDGLFGTAYLLDDNFVNDYKSNSQNKYKRTLPHISNNYARYMLYLEQNPEVVMPGYSVEIVGAGDDEMFSGERYDIEHILMEVEPQKIDNYDFDELLDGIREFVENLRIYSSSKKGEIWNKELAVCIINSEKFCQDIKLKENPLKLDERTQVVFIDSHYNLILAGRRKKPISILDKQILFVRRWKMFLSGEGGSI